ncbi:hypothetical protein MLD38_012777 [Melastoma candidum]|uniref:Uncharacterized protein n=1 Tax=Melastoma candidum TaxID=119954 RepID=A0ACB9R7F3_9MYRT|nr:hypothetical protein MLD38_012777 [Melastoma candidum]
MGLLFLVEWLLPLLLLFAQSMPAFSLKAPQSNVVYLGPHKQGAQVTEQDIEEIKSSHFNLIGSVRGR